MKEYDYLTRYFFLSSLGILAVMVSGGEMPSLAPAAGRIWELIYLAVFPSCLAYLFWDIAMKRGRRNLVVAASFLIPLVSTMISGLHLRVRIGPPFWAAAFLIVTGAVLSHRAIRDPDD